MEQTLIKPIFRIEKVKDNAYNDGYYSDLVSSNTLNPDRAKALREIDSIFHRLRMQKE